MAPDPSLVDTQPDDELFAPAGTDLADLPEDENGIG